MLTLSRVGDAMTVTELEIGKSYNFHTEHTIYENAKLKAKDADGGISIWWRGMARVHIASRELIKIENVRGSD